VNRFGGQLMLHITIQKYNLSVAFRLGWTQHIKIIFFIPVALMGFDPVLFLYVIKLRFSQFWIHTEYIRKLPPQLNILSLHLIIEFIIQAMINIWIRTLDQHLSFGIECLAFQSEEEKPVYGITTPINSYNPITLNFHIWKDIISDVMKSRSLKEAYALMFTNPSKLEAVKASTLLLQRSMNK
jgi:hypothetical protein